MVLARAGKDDNSRSSLHILDTVQIMSAESSSTGLWVQRPADRRLWLHHGGHKVGNQHVQAILLRYTSYILQLKPQTISHAFNLSLPSENFSSHPTIAEGTTSGDARIRDSLGYGVKAAAGIIRPPYYTTLEERDKATKERPL